MNDVTESLTTSRLDDEVPVTSYWALIGQDCPLGGVGLREGIKGSAQAYSVTREQAESRAGSKKSRVEQEIEKAVEQKLRRQSS